jgi:diguanylate cyclase (GGDEF)-like protein
LLVDRIGHALAVAKRDATTTAVLYADIDNFKLVNESLGHHAGDELLVQVARRLQDTLRAHGSGIRANGDTLARIGGDEFVVLCESLSAERHAIGIAERINSAFAPPFEVGNERLFARLSIGVALASSGATAASMIRDADAAMHQAKERGGARYEVFDADIRARVLNRIRRENDLRQALEGDQLRLYYQPIVSVLDESIVGAEALIRWEHPEQGLLAPAEFIPLAEETGLIVPIGSWVIERACAQLAEWHSSLGPSSPLHISVNVSPRQVTEDDLVSLITDLLEEHRLGAPQLILEVTESMLLTESSGSVAALGQLHDIGVRLALDDFGTGYSSLSYLRSFPFNVLKLDRSFISGLDHIAADVQIAAAVIEMARALAMTVIAEGVETLEQLEILRRLGCHLAQGFYFAAPIPEHEFSQLLAQADSRRRRLVKPAELLRAPRETVGAISVGAGRG